MCADFAQPKPDLTISEAAKPVIQERVTELVSTSNSEFAKELIAHGCTTKRNAIAMTCGPTHPDHLPGNRIDLIREHLQPLLDRTELGVNHRSSIAILHGGIPIAGIIISLREGSSPFGGPWISEIWVDPKHQGQGIAKYLITQTQEKLKEDNYTSLGLAVTNGNQAKQLYEYAGFTVVEEFWTLSLPTV